MYCIIINIILIKLKHFLERPEPTSTSGVASDKLLSRGIEPRSRLATALLSLMAGLNVQERRMKRVRARVREIIICKHDLMIRFKVFRHIRHLFNFTEGYTHTWL